MNLTTTALLDLSHTLAGSYLAQFQYPWGGCSYRHAEVKSDEKVISIGDKGVGGYPRFAVNP